MPLDASTVIDLHSAAAKTARQARQRWNLAHAQSARARNGAYPRFAKRALDGFILGLFAVPVVLLVVLLAALVALDGGRPFYAQRRVGQHRRLFAMYKLRTMVPDADRRLRDYLARNPEAAREWQIHQKLRHDPRITPIGRFLRRTSLDELPQLLNVLRGEMSLIGPRPILPAQLPLYSGSAYFELRPGLSGPWQVADRNEADFAQRARFDELYARSVSLFTDLKLIALTFGAVARLSGR